MISLDWTLQSMTDDTPCLCLTMCEVVGQGGGEDVLSFVGAAGVSLTVVGAAVGWLHDAAGTAVTTSTAALLNSSSLLTLYPCQNSV